MGNAKSKPIGGSGGPSASGPASAPGPPSGSAPKPPSSSLSVEESRNFDASYGMGPPRRSFHEGLMRVRDHQHDFNDIYEMLDVIGQGGICEIYKIKKKYEMMGGSSREENVRRRSGKSKSLISRINKSPRAARPKNRQRGYSGDVPAGAHMYFALKVINLALVKEDSIDQLQNEVEILKSLDHKNIIKAYETFQVKPRKQLMIVMELCTGGDLHARIPYTEQQAANVTKQVIKAISYLHSKSIIHRDIKFENVIFESAHPEAVIKVIDFGLSKAYSPSNNILTERVGTLYSMSPETMQGIYTSQADLWSIGVCTYMMMTAGQKPFEATTPKKLVARVLLGDYNFDDQIWQGASDRAKEFITELLVVDPHNRISADQALYHPWLTDVNSHDGFSAAPDEAFVQRVREGIVNYADQGEFRKLALNVIAKKSSSQEIFELRKVFDQFDTLNTGTITLADFSQVLSEFDYTEEDIMTIFRKVDINRNNVINYTEFLAAALETQGTIEEYRLAEAFDLMDVDDSGYISRENLRFILGDHTDERYIDQLIAEADFKRDGRISYEEFLQVFSKQTHDNIYAIYEGAEAECFCSDATLSADEVLTSHGIISTLRKRANSASNLVGSVGRSPNPQNRPQRNTSSNPMVTVARSPCRKQYKKEPEG